MPANPPTAIPAVCILFGRKGRQVLFDDYLQREHLASIKAALDEGGQSQPVTYDATEADIADVMDEVQTPSLWGGSRLIVLEKAEALLAPPVNLRESVEGLMKRLLVIAEAAASSGHLVLVARALDVKANQPKTSFKPAQALINAVRTRNGLFSCVPPFESALKRNLVAAAAQQGKRLLPQAANLLVRIAGTEQLALREELKKLISHAGDREAITASDVEALASARDSSNVFNLADSILDQNAPRAFEILAELRRASTTRSSAFIIPALAASFRRYLSAAQLVSTGASPRQAASASRVPSFAIDAFTARLAKWPAPRLENLLERALGCDVEVKTGSQRDEIALAAFVSDACSGARGTHQLVGRWIYEV